MYVQACSHVPVGWLICVCLQGEPGKLLDFHGDNSVADVAKAVFCLSESQDGRRVQIIPKDTNDSSINGNLETKQRDKMHIGSRFSSLGPHHSTLELLS